MRRTRERYLEIKAQLDAEVEARQQGRQQASAAHLLEQQAQKQAWEVEEMLARQAEQQEAERKLAASLEIQQMRRY